MDRKTSYGFKPRERIFCLDGERFLVDGIQFNQLEEFLRTLDSIPIQLKGGQEHYHLSYDSGTGTLEIGLESFDDGKVMRDPPEDFYALEKAEEMEGNVLRVVNRGALDEPMVKFIKVKRTKSK